MSAIRESIESTIKKSKIKKVIYFSTKGNR